MLSPNAQTKLTLQPTRPRGGSTHTSRLSSSRCPDDQSDMYTTRQMSHMYCAVHAFQHADADLARDLLSTNRRLVNTEELAIFGTMVVAGATADHIKVLIPDTFSGPTVNADSPVVLQHVVGLTMGPPVDLSSSLPVPNLDRALCRNSVLPTLTKRKRSYWTEVNPILRRWQHVNDAKCPVCDGLIRVNMSRHLRLSHTTCQCFWRCPVPSCPAWFASELYGKDHLE